jgi:hypothetical protein
MAQITWMGVNGSNECGLLLNTRHASTLIWLSLIQVKCKFAFQVGLRSELIVRQSTPNRGAEHVTPNAKPPRQPRKLMELLSSLYLTNKLTTQDIFTYSHGFRFELVGSLREAASTEQDLARHSAAERQPRCLKSASGSSGSRNG